MARIHPKHQKRKNQKGIIDDLVYFAAYVQPFMTLPQIYTIWIRHTNGVSLFSWSAYLSFSLIWLLYALKIHDKPLIITYILWILTEGLVVTGLILK
jgi:uncharacterized protein with PQ loop repeat